MATRLIEIVSATDVEPGQTVVITHHLNVTVFASLTPVIPDWIAKDNPVFEGVAATSTTITVRNDSAETASGNFYLFYDHSNQRVYGSDVGIFGQLTPAPFWINGAGSVVPTVVGANSNCLVFQPGGAGVGPTVFNAWADLMTQLDTLRADNGGGCYSVEIDDSLAAATIPAGGPYDFTDTTLKGAGNGASVTIAEGASFTKLRMFQDLIVVFAGTGTSPITDVVNGDVFWVRDTVLSTTTAATVGLIAYTLAGAGDVTIWLMEGAAIGGAQTGRVIDVAGAHTLTISIDSSSAIAIPTAVRGAAATTLTLRPVSGVVTPGIADLSNWSGTKGWTTFGAPASLAPNPADGSPSLGGIATTGHGQWLLMSAALGSFTQTLPPILNATNGQCGPGTFLLLTNPDTGSNQARYTPAAGDSILQPGGNATFTTGLVAVPRGGSVLLVSDGASNWYYIGAWGLNRYQPAECWFQDDVPASQTNVDLGTLVSAQFATWRAPKAGYIVGLVSRFNTPVTAGTATVTATINGTEVVGIMSVVSTAGSNPSGGVESSVPLAAVAYAAGDLLGVSITTDGSFAPTTADLEATLVIAEGP